MERQRLAVSQEGDSFVVKVKEPPKEGRANQAIIKLLAELFRFCPVVAAFSSLDLFGVAAPFSLFVVLGIRLIGDNTSRVNLAFSANDIRFGVRVAYMTDLTL